MRKVLARISVGFFALWLLGSINYAYAAAAELLDTVLYCNPSTYGLVAYWNFDGANANDAYGSNNGTSNNGSVTYATSSGLFGTDGANFSGAPYLTVPDNSALSPSNITVMFWFNIQTNPSPYTAFLEKRDEVGGSAGWQIGYAANGCGGVHCFYWDVAGTELSYDSTASTNTWIQLAITQTSGGLATLYLNGSAVASSTGIAGISNYATSLYIGARSDHLASGYYFTGYMEDIAILNTALSSSTINGYYNGTLGGCTTSAPKFRVEVIIISLLHFKAEDKASVRIA